MEGNRILKIAFIKGDHMERVRHLIYMALLVAVAFVLHYIERHMSMVIMTPGAKLGLANIVTVFALYTLSSPWDTLKIISLRLILTSVLGGGMMGLMYASGGALVSFVAMLSTKALLKEKVSIIGVSVMGAVGHNVGQMIVAICIVETLGIIVYLPLLTLVGILTGIAIGQVGNYLIKHMHRLPLLGQILHHEKIHFK